MRRASLERFAYAACVAVTTGLVFLLYLQNLTSHEDLNGETLDVPLTMTFLEEAHGRGMTFAEFTKVSPVIQTLLVEDPGHIHAYVHGMMQFDYFASQSPLIGFLYLPFLKVFGTNNMAVAMYSVTWCLVGMIPLWVLLHRAFGRWHPFPALWLLLGNLAWIIHVKVAYPVWMPSFVALAFEALALFMYLTTGRVRYLVACGIVLGMLGLIAWVTIAFGVLMCLLLVPYRDISYGVRGVVRSMGVVGVASMLPVACLVPPYCIRYGLAMSEVIPGLVAGILLRFQQGGVPVARLSSSGKLGYAAKCLLVDSTTIDHLDKCLEGVPAVGPVFAALGAVGCLYAFRARKSGDVVFLAWFASVFGFLTMAFDYTHRYGIMGLPALAALASRGSISLVTELRSTRGSRVAGAAGVAIALGIAATSWHTYRDYYVFYETAKPPEFEGDRMRGMHDLGEWLKRHCDPDDTLVILGDPVMLNRNSFLFYTQPLSYDFKYYSTTCHERLGIRDAETLRKWQEEMFAKHPTIVYVVPFVNCYGTDPIYWAPLADLLSNSKPDMVYAFADRAPSLAVFRVDRQMPESIESPR